MTQVASDGQLCTFSPASLPSLQVILRRASKNEACQNCLLTQLADIFAEGTAIPLKVTDRLQSAKTGNDTLVHLSSHVLS